jgi:hypothetical protein
LIKNEQLQEDKLKEIEKMKEQALKNGFNIEFVNI